MFSLRLLLTFTVFYYNSIDVTAKYVENFDKVPRVMFWPGKVNQYCDETTGWQFQTDPIGMNLPISTLDYCKKFYPLTLSVRYYKNETSMNWYSAGNVRLTGYGDIRYAYEVGLAKFASYECVQPALNNPRIMYWSGKVNQHASFRTGWRWVSDPDGVSGATINTLDYCQKLFPDTVGVIDYTYEVSDSWVTVGSSGVSTGGAVSMQCVQRDNFYIAYND